MYLHLYFNGEKALEDEKNFNIMLGKLHGELESGKRNPEHEKQHDKYFDIIECFEQPGHDLRVGEVTKRQVELYEAMEIAPPASLH